MIEATYATKDGNTRMIYANSFQELFKHLEGKDVVEIAACTINLTQMKQGKERLTNA